MKLLIFTTKKDWSAKLIFTEARKRKLNCKIIYYNNLAFQKGKLTKNGRKINIGKKDKIILRYPYLEGEYSFFVNKLLEEYSKNILLDVRCFKKYPQYEDKLFQADLFYKNKIKVPENFYGNVIPKKFPVVIKKRISSRCKGNYIIKNKTNLKKFFKDNEPSEYIIQEYIKAEKDYRILILKGKILGIVERRIRIRKDDSIGVKLTENSDLPKRILQQSVNVYKCFKADLLGVDLVKTKDNKYYFIEGNLMPQFRSFTRMTKINVAEKIINLVKK